VRAAVLRAAWALLLLVPTAHAGSWLVIDSEPGDVVTFGDLDVLAEPRASFYAQRDTQSDPQRQAVSVDVEGSYAARVYLGPRPGHPLVAGTYENTQISNTADTPYLVVQAAGYCFDMTGRFVLNDIATDAQGELTTLSMDFEGKCASATGGFHGSLRYKRGDPSCAAAADGAPCDDENPCTTSDACADGRCVGATSAICAPAGQCELGVCSPWTGACDVTFESVGTDCDDGNGCTVFDGCLASLCVPGPPRFCDDLDVCTDDTCTDGACVSTPVECPASSDPCLVPVCRDDSSARGCTFEEVPECCHEDVDCDDKDLCTHDACDPATHRCTNDSLGCWLLTGKSTTTVSAAGRSETRPSRFGALLVFEPGGRYRLPKFAGCEGVAPIDEVGSLVPARARRTRLVAANLDEQRAVFRSCYPPLSVRRHTGWIRIDPDTSALRGGVGLHGKGRYQGVPFTYAVSARFKGRPVAHVIDGALRGPDD
jgi:hypothetical protein